MTAPDSIEHQGKTFSVSHLAPFTLSCPCDDIGRDIRISVIFTLHTYTEQFDPEEHDEEQIIHREAKDRARVFCEIRHKLSIELPGIIRGLPQRKVNQTPEQRNYVYMVPLKTESGIYAVYFQLQRSNDQQHDLRLTVESAYLRSSESPVKKRPREIRFRVLAYKVLKGEKVKFAPR